MGPEASSTNQPEANSQPNQEPFKINRQRLVLPPRRTAYNNENPATKTNPEKIGGANLKPLEIKFSPNLINPEIKADAQKTAETFSGNQVINTETKVPQSKEQQVLDTLKELNETATGDFSSEKADDTANFLNNNPSIEDVDRYIASDLNIDSASRRLLLDYVQDLVKQKNQPNKPKSEPKVDKTPIIESKLESAPILTEQETLKVLKELEPKESFNQEKFSAVNEFISQEPSIQDVDRYVASDLNIDMASRRVLIEYIQSLIDQKTPITKSESEPTTITQPETEIQPKSKEVDELGFTYDGAYSMLENALKKEGLTLKSVERYPVGGLKITIEQNGKVLTGEELKKAKPKLFEADQDGNTPIGEMTRRLLLVEKRFPDKFEVVPPEPTLRQKVSSAFGEAKQKALTWFKPQRPTPQNITHVQKANQLIEEQKKATNKPNEPQSIDNLLNQQITEAGLDDYLPVAEQGNAEQIKANLEIIQTELATSRKALEVLTSLLGGLKEEAEAKQKSLVREASNIGSLLRKVGGLFKGKGAKQ